MTVYNINLSIGWASSGVEYAQVYRDKAFKRLGISSKYVFCDMMTGDNILDMTANIGLQDEDIIWLYNHLTDVPFKRTEMTVSDIERYYGLQGYLQEDNKNLGTIKLSKGTNYFMCYYDKAKNFIHRVEIVEHNYLVRKDYFFGKVCQWSEYYTPRNNRAYLYARKWFNVNHSVVMSENVNDGKSIYKFTDEVCYTKEQLVARFVRSLNLGISDVLILDRATTTGQAVLQNKGLAKVLVIVHAEHWSDFGTDDKFILWNNYYEYQFRNHKYIDGFVCATNLQSEKLKKDFEKEYGVSNAPVVTIPVGNLDVLRNSENRKKNSAVTASRLADEKHIDILIKASAEVLKSIPDFTLDIYGKGVLEADLQKLIDELGIGENVKLRGHHDMTDVYQNYDVYLSASGSEGFGLTLMETIGSGTGLIGYDVPYGNPTFCKEGQNGYLLPRPENWTSVNVNEYAETVVKFFALDSKNVIETSHLIANDYLIYEVADKWAKEFENLGIKVK